jgi:hypothetical protein
LDESDAFRNRAKRPQAGSTQKGNDIASLLLRQPAGAFDAEWRRIKMPQMQTANNCTVGESRLNVD